MVASAEVAGTVGRSGWWIVAGVLVWVGLMIAGGWLLHGWVERRFGLPADLAWSAAALPGGVLGMLLILKIPRPVPSTDPELRRREAERAETMRRRGRGWMIAAMCVILLPQAGRVAFASYSDLAADGGWGTLVIAFSMVTNGLTDVLPSRAGVPSGKVCFDQAERCEALRVGYLTLVVLGGLVAVMAIWRPANAAQAWPFVLLASVLAAEIRMATLPRRAMPLVP